MAGIYKSRYSGEEIDEALSRSLDYNPEENGWLHLPSSEKAPINFATLISTGNFIIDHFVDSPNELSNVSPINIIIFNNDGTLYQSIPFFDYVYYRKYDSSKMEYGDWKYKKSTNTIFIDEAPENAEEKSISISKDEHGDYRIQIFKDGKWIDINPPDVMLKSIYDTENRGIDFYKYVDDHIAELNGTAEGKDNLADILEHIQNEEIHFSEEDRQSLNTRETKENVLVKFNQVENSLKEHADQITQKAIEDGNQLKLDFDELEDHFTEHINNLTKHPNQEERDYWDAKAEPDHTHNLDDRVKIHASQVIGGKLDLKLIPEGAKELVTKVQSIEERNQLTIDDVQNGDRVAVYGEGIYEVVDETKLAYTDEESGGLVPAQEEAFYECSAGSGVFIDWKNVENTPTTIGGYGIEDTYTKPEFDKLMNDIIDEETERLENRYDEYDLDELYKTTYDTKANVDTIQSEIEDAISITQDVRQLEIKVKEQNERMVIMSQDLTEAQLTVNYLLQIFS